MSNDIEKFLLKASADPALEARVNAATSLEALEAIAREEGFSFDEAAHSSEEISDGDLATVAGGDANSNRLTLAYTKLNDLMQKYNQMTELQSSQVKKLSDLTSGIVSRLR